MTWTIHGDRGSGSQIPEMLLAEAGAPVTLIDHALETNAQRDPQYLALDPTGELPALHDHAQRVLARPANGQGSRTALPDLAARAPRG